MPILKYLVWTLAGILMAGTGAAYGQNYPIKPIHIITSDPGGGSDFAARLIAQGLTRNIGQQVIVENREGGSGVIAAQTLTKAAPDGYTLLLYSSGIWILPLLQNVPYDPVKDFTPITLAGSSPNIIVVRASSPVNSVKELIALAKATPGQLNYASGGSGGPPHLAAELFKDMAGVNIVRIPYKGTGQALLALMSNQVQVMFASAALAAGQVKAGKLKPLAVCSAQPSALFPELPTVAASGLPGYEAVSPVGIFAPADTPATLVNRLNREIVKVLNMAEVKEQFFNAGVEVVGSSPDQFAAAIKSEITKMSKVIRNAGIRSE
jgi:tripartite-type tricarboxylate transporter receptor subunit TctC